MTISTTMSNEEYHLSDALSASGAKTIAMKSLAHYKYAERKESTAFDVGTATHTLPRHACRCRATPSAVRRRDRRRVFARESSCSHK